MENYSVLTRKKPSYAIPASSLWWIIQGFAIMLTNHFECAWFVGLLLIGMSVINAMVHNFSYTTFYLISLLVYSFISFFASIIIYSVQGWMYPETGLLILLAAANIVIAGYVLWIARAR